MADEDITLEEFEALPDTRGEVSKVDYDAVIEAILGKPVSVKSIMELMKEYSTGKKRVYYSEATGFIDRLTGRKGFKVRIGYGEKKFILVTKE